MQVPAGSRGRGRELALVLALALFISFLAAGQPGLVPPAQPSGGGPGFQLVEQIGKLAGSRMPESSGPVPNPFVTDMPASLVIGQTSLTGNGPGSGSSQLASPRGIAFDAAGDLWLTDSQNSRVLEYVPPFSTGMAASIALGQSSLMTRTPSTSRSGMASPVALAFGPGGSLWVDDAGNNRVLEFTPPFATGMSASLVLGQESFTTLSIGTSAQALDLPTGLAFTPGGDLLVVDALNNRVVEYTPPFSTGMNASLVLGQGNFTASGSGTSATTFNEPVAIAVGPSGEVFVADIGNNRVLGFPGPLATGMAASVVIGQTGFGSSSFGTSASSMNRPLTVGMDALGDLWTTEAGNNRVLEFVPPFATGMAASLVLGQPDFGGGSSGSNSTALYVPAGVAEDSGGHLWVADESNNRVLEYVPATFPLDFVESGLPSGTAWSVSIGETTLSSRTNTIAFLTENGSYAYGVPAVGGYVESSGPGPAIVNGSGSIVQVAFSSAAPALPASVFWLLVGGIPSAIAVVEGVLLVQLHRSLARSRRALAPESGSGDGTSPPSPGHSP
jgi:sugar lactone lactonase YvrE